MEKINLEELFNNNFDCHTIDVINWKQVEVPVLTKDKFKEVCINLSKQLLALAAYNSKIEIKTVGEELIITDVHQEDNYTRIQVNLKSILDTIKEIE